MSTTLVTFLARAAASQRGVTFVERNEERHTYTAIAERAYAAAHAILARGVAPGERVGIVLPTGVGFYDAFFGAILAGAVPTPLYPPMRLGRLDEYHQRTAGMLRAVDASLVITDGRVGKLLGPSLEAARPRRGWMRANELAGGVACALPTIRPDDVAFIQFSSGTTSFPKAVQLTHAQIVANVESILAAIVAAHPDVVHSAVSWLPLYHDMGLIGCVLAALAYPGDLTLLPPENFVAEPARWLRTLSEKRATISAAPNFAYALCAERIRDDELSGVDLSSWCVALNGAEPVAPRVLERFTSRFASVGFRREALTPVYGLAEATLGVCFSDLKSAYHATRFSAAKLLDEGVAVESNDADAVSLIALGKPLASVDVRIADDDTNAMADGQLGRIMVRGRSVTRGYLGEAPRPDEAWLDTGDTGFLFAGNLYVYGRTKDIIIVRGRKYAPHDIEHALDGLEGVRAGCVAAFGVPGASGEELAIVVEHARDAVVDPIKVRDCVTAATGLVAEHVIIAAPGTLPRTSSGKISRSETSRRYASNTLSAPGRVTAVGLGLRVLRSQIGMARTRGGA